MIHDVNCPYCNAEIEICHDDGFGYEEGTLHQYECPKCEKNFVFETYINVTHEAYPADCLNTGRHKFKLTKTIPKRYSRWRCRDCGAEKEISESMKLKFINEEKAEAME